MSQAWTPSEENVVSGLTDRGGAGSERALRGVYAGATASPRAASRSFTKEAAWLVGRGSRVKSKHLWVGLFCSLAALGRSAPALAGIEECGNINVDADATCTVEVEGGCEGQCTPVTVQAACAGELELGCRGRCDVDAELSCTATCNIASCVAECDIDPPEFDCTAECNVQAEAECAGQCEADADRRQCEASCKATYSASCDASCQGTPPSASCQAKCEARCEADCSARANVDCQVACQAEGYVACETRVQGGCEVACSRPEGALFCDGQYVDPERELQECIDAIEARLDIEVEARGSASSDCSGNTCSGDVEGEASASCDLGSGAPGAGAPGALGLLLAAAGAAGARLRRKR